MISLALWNLRSTENVASILRTADGFGVANVYFIGTTPYPELPNDPRLPHIRKNMTQKIAKISLGAEQTLTLAHYDDIDKLYKVLPKSTQVIALEQAPNSHILPNLPPLSNEILLVVGEERHGLPSSELYKVSDTVEIPMRGQKESFNVAVATGIALYALTTSMI
ncbi:MAG: hypothetical protein LBM12_02730 [Candidatus Nomurabacteria bacterium]|jgi:tRNA G18 (ribose-2'-O)-methylase SpoU|nr:hypothetical protein [Candidatus Nomurabacteria bacterium]